MFLVLCFRLFHRLHLFIIRSLRFITMGKGFFFPGPRDARDFVHKLLVPIAHVRLVLKQHGFRLTVSYRFLQVRLRLIASAFDFSVAYQLARSRRSQLDDRGEVFAVVDFIAFFVARVFNLLKHGIAAMALLVLFRERDSCVALAFFYQEGRLGSSARFVIFKSAVKLIPRVFDLHWFLRSVLV
jgi:hypothetical protein